MTKIAFDVNNTLIKTKDENVMSFSYSPRYEIIQMLITLSKLPDTEIYVWSSGGMWYANEFVRELGLEEYVDYIVEKNFQGIDICFDDRMVNLAKVNIKV